MSYIDDKAYVLSHTDQRTLLEQLAEEAAELSQAALKLIRAEGLSDNPTPANVSIASEQLNEEFADVLMAADAIGIPILESWDNSKWRRWAARIREECERGGICNGCFGAAGGDCDECGRKKVVKALKKVRKFCASQERCYNCVLWTKENICVIKNIPENWDIPSK